MDNSVHSADSSFVTCSGDMSVDVWRHFGDRWSFSYIDVAKCFDPALNFQRKNQQPSSANLKLTALALYPRSPFIAVVDNTQVLRVFDFSHD